MNVYVAGAYCDKPTVQQVQAALTALGCRVTHDWTSRDATTALEDALADEGGVNRAEIVVIVFSVAEHAYRGTFTEMGMALALGKMVVALRLVDGDYKHNPFLHLPQVRTVHSLDELVALINAMPYEERLRVRLGLTKPRNPGERKYVPLQESSDEDDESSSSC
jgi:nucleoside 2-deoxyribosyltransferase